MVELKFNNYPIPDKIVHLLSTIIWILDKSIKKLIKLPESEIETSMVYSEIFRLLSIWFLGSVGEFLTHTTRSVGSNPTNGVDVSEAEFASEVGDGGGGSVLCAAGVGERKINCNFFLHHMMKYFLFDYPKNG